MSEEERSEARAHESFLIKFAIKWVAITLCTLVATIAGCNMHSNVYEPDVEAEETKQYQSRYEHESLKEKQRLATFEKLVEKGYDPQAVRCAIMGPTVGNTSAEICKKLAGIVKVIPVQQ